MKSTSTSKTLLSVENLNLVFQTEFYRSLSWRDIFTKASRDPWGTFFGEKDRLHIAKNLSFSVKHGERVGIIGVNGSGKTTLCRCIAGMYRQTSGTIERKGSIRSIFDTSVGIQPELTGRENAQLLAEFMYPDEPDKRDIVEESLEFSELREFVDAPYRSYSKGMQARLCLSLISARPCDLLILDEVFDGADAFFSEKIAERVLDLIKRSGAVLFVSHSVGQIRKVCNRVFVMEAGVIVFDGDVEQGIEFYQGRGPRK